MRYVEFATRLDEDIAQKSKLQAGNPLSNAMIDGDTITGLLTQAGFSGSDDLLWKTKNNLEVLIDVAPGAQVGQFRKDTLLKIAQVLKAGAPMSKPSVTALGDKVGNVIFGDGSPIKIYVKDRAGKGGNSRGKPNEENLRSMLQILIMEYETINVTFVDPRGKKISIKNCNEVQDASMNVADRQKADLILTSTKGNSLPISLKQITADSWESGDTLFGPRARVIVDKLVKKGLVQLIPIGTKEKAKRVVQYYKLSKEIVVEPSEEDAINAIFGNDLLPKGGIAIQTFKDEHFEVNENNVTIQCDYVITKKSDIPESHLMVWNIRNGSDRGSEDSGIGIPGIRVLGAILTRGIGVTGLKDVILVDQKGNVIANPNQKAIDYAQHKKSINKSARDYAGASAVGRA